MAFYLGYVEVKEFRIMQTCSVCGEGFDSDYKLTKHLSSAHKATDKAGWVGGDDDSCSCSEHTHPREES